MTYDFLLDMSSPTFADDLREAIGVKPGETLQIMTPQFEREDGLVVPVPLLDFNRIAEFSDETLKAIGCRAWDEPDQNGDVLWLFPYQWYNHIPDGLMVHGISNDFYAFKRGETDDDMRYGVLAYGFKKRATVSQKEIDT
jgi:hypothetical protein